MGLSSGHLLEWATAEAHHEDHPRSGDVAVVEHFDGGALVAAIDGLGHGDEAADAADAAALVLRAAPDDPPEELLRRCHEALLRTRGAVMTLARFDAERDDLCWLGVGNVEARLLRAGQPRGTAGSGPVLYGGVVGYTLPSIRPSRTNVAAGDTLVLATDGVRADFSSELMAGAPPDVLARLVMQRHARGDDDALVLVVRVLPHG